MKDFIYHGQFKVQAAARRVIGLLLLILLASVFITPSAQAHFFVLHSAWYKLDLESDAHGGTPAKTHFYLGWGHIYPVEEPLPQEKVTRYAVIAPDGSETQLEPMDDTFQVATYAPEAVGTHIAHAVYEDHYFTWYTEDGEEKEFAGPKTGLDNIVYSGYFEMRAKAVINAGRGSDASAQRVLGDTLELIPMENPGRKMGDAYQKLPVKVLFKGEPLEDAVVFVRHMGDFPRQAFSQRLVSDEAGLVQVELPRKGLYLVQIEHTTPPEPERETLCNIEQYYATLTFEVE